MRLLLLIPLLLLVGCSEQESESDYEISEIDYLDAEIERVEAEIEYLENKTRKYKNAPEFTKEPTYLKCDKTFINGQFIWMVIDHANELMILASSLEKPTSEYSDVVNAVPLFTSERYYGYITQPFDRPSDWKVNRSSLKYSDGYWEYDCELQDDLSELRALGIESIKPKI